ncbi:Anaphase-promoting complex subunit 5 [Christiangramia echinicola]|uniref:Anaphase-promoting complex subunit 5 n=1 Tax=Christiangramia echinicola TaxID=279359 RepID=A0A1H1LCM6_9FLAO|nr:Anaphase-promoting complex subunit 5 [Christiangramia echinicola]
MIIYLMTLLYNLLKRSVIYFIPFLYITCLLSGCANTSKRQIEAAGQTTLSNKIFDSITDFEGLSNYDKRLLVNQVTIDSIHSELVFDLSYHYYQNGDSLEFRFWNNVAQQLGLENKKLSAEAQWDLGNFFYGQSIIDSSYYHYYRAYKEYNAISDPYYAARMQLNMAILQENVKDYIGSEVSTIEAVQVFENLGKKKQQYIAYSNLGIVSNGLDHYTEAIQYHQEAIAIAEQMQDYNLQATSLNNLGVVFEHKANYDSAVYYYKKALAIDEVKEKNPRVHAMLLDNLAYSEFKISPNKEAIDLSRKALHIRNDIEHSSGQLINKLHLAEMEDYLGHKDSAIKILSETRKLAEETDNYDYLLMSLIQLSEVDSNSGSEYFNSYHKLNDSLIKEERLVRNKFARIRYETDEYIEENKLLSQQQLFLGSFFIVSMVIAVLLYYQKDLRSKNSELVYESRQQVANEKIYGLILNEQARMEEARSQERHRISGDLHDGVLGKLFATRLSLSLLGHKFLSDVPENQKVYDNYIAEIQTIEKEIRSISHDLKNDFNNDQETFIQLVQDLIKTTRKVTEIEIRFTNDKNISWDLITNDRLIHLYRILQETIQNTIKHSQATHLDIEFLEEEGELRLIIKDDGIGFKRNNKKGIGLKNMRHRVAQLKGLLDIQSSPKGVCITIKIPISDTAYEE